jgi:hypothetical protein
VEALGPPKKTNRPIFPGQRRIWVKRRSFQAGSAPPGQENRRFNLVCDLLAENLVWARKTGGTMV